MSKPERAASPPAAYGSQALTQSLRAAARHMRGALDGLAPAEKLAAPRIAVILPCHNEAAAIGRVVQDFRAALPGARLIVFDNASSDATAELAAAAGAEVPDGRRRRHL